MDEMITITLNRSTWETVISELVDGESSRWCSDDYHAQDCPSQVKHLIENALAFLPE